MADQYNLGALPKRITGGCLCGKIRYEGHFPDNHDFKQNSGTCQCTQCRRSTSHLFFMWHKVPYSLFKWTASTDTLKNYYCSKGNARGFCGNCGTFLYWRRESGPNINIAIGTIDPLYLFGEGWEDSGGEVPKGGFGRALANSCGGHEWVRNEIPGVTDELELVGAGPRGRGERVEAD
ncbi:glutathione-dependent formaldehyde-activating GFA [Cercophora newfieldiana]|uniref:Glutathione-dependent formaldehyde-activating GFA n=1 Tax=Cercophora newfieldiana TaxID=92897 RepID=A0AA40CUT0_9PEZI|nr:glutathione-dependent formaldehyde-activating GFA [Cercophora newfieldiana]